jgi:hypothetical protein
VAREVLVHLDLDFLVSFSIKSVYFCQRKGLVQDNHTNFVIITMNDGPAK